MNYTKLWEMKVSRVYTANSPSDSKESETLAKGFFIGEIEHDIEHLLKNIKIEVKEVTSTTT